MQLTSTVQRQHFLYLAITIVILALAVSLVRYQEYTQNKIANEINAYRLIMFESSKIKQELAQILFQKAYRTLADEQGSANNLDSEQILYGARFNLSVSLYTIRSNFVTLIQLLEGIDTEDRLLKKLKVQVANFETLEPLLRSENEVGTNEVFASLQSLALTIEQLEGLQNIKYKERAEMLDALIHRDNRILIGFLATLVVISYLLIRLTSHRIQTTKDRFTAELEDKNAELERFVYTVSHDLRAPLVSIKGFVGLLQKDIAASDREKVLHDLDRIAQAADDMGGLLEGLLELSRIGRIIHPPESGSLENLVHRAVEPLQDKISKQGITIVIAGNMPDFWGDQLRLSEVFQNLIENAIKFMGNQPSPRIEIDARLDEDQIVCVVKDNGIGIEPIYHERVFNLFERFNPEIEGTGIGMALVKRIIEAHGGTIEIHSDGAQKGCRIIFTLPVKHSDEDSRTGDTI